MALADWMDWLEALPFSLAISESQWMFPTIEVVHVVAIATVFGSITMVDLRLLGVARRTEGARALTEEMLPWTWVAFVVAAITGTLMFVSAASRYFDNIPFRFKMVMLALAGANMALFHLTSFRSIAQWDRECPPPAKVRLAGGMSLALWITIVFLGRWVGFIDK